MQVAVNWTTCMKLRLRRHLGWGLMQTPRELEWSSRPAVAEAAAVARATAGLVMEA